MTTYVRNYASADVLVVGGGEAGLRAAIEARAHGADVLIVSQPRVGYGSNTAISGGAFAAVTEASRAAGDSCDQRLADTVRAGCFISDQAVALICGRYQADNLVVQHSRRSAASRA